MITSPGYKTIKLDIIDNLIMRRICEPCAPILKSTNHTANLISTYGCIFMIGALYNLYNDNIFRFSTYFWISYVLDCLDGYYARRYNMVTKFGDIFEHVRDVLSLLFIVCICCYKYHVNMQVIMITLIACGLTCINVACVQNRFVDRSYDETLDIFKCVCFHNRLHDISMYYGVGMFMFTVQLLILYLSGGVIFIIKLTLITTILLYFVGMHLQTNDVMEERIEHIDIPSDCIPPPL